VVLHVEQRQERVHDTPIFRAPVLIGITAVEGRTTQKVWLTNQSEDIELDVPSKPLLVRFNEGNHLLAEITVPERLRRSCFLVLTTTTSLGGCGQPENWPIVLQIQGS
jgi:hypothetical protein